MKRILILEPYFGGSHKHFLHGLMDNVEADFVLMSLPARKWKMRMQLSALWFVQQLELLPTTERHFDTVLCSTFVDASVFSAMVVKIKGWNRKAKICIYFHENQFEYPNRTADRAVYQFTAINFNSALAADSLAFNSEFNRRTFLEGCQRYLKFASDMKFTGAIESIKVKSRVIHPGIDFSIIDRVPKQEASQVPVIVWNHRWEHDKNPNSFFDGLHQLKEKGADFKLIILGQSFSNSPSCFTRCPEQFSEELIHFGYAESYEDYIELLAKGTIIVSTSIHEFYGISIIEAVRSGCRPLLPNRLSYPELFPEKYLYAEGQFPSQLERVVMENKRIKLAEAKNLTATFSWSSLKEKYGNWLL